MNHFELTDEEYEQFCELIYRAAGIRIADNKRVMVSNRVRRRLRATGIESFAEYYTFLTSPAGGGEMPLFLDAITTNETYFFRDPAALRVAGQRRSSRRSAAAGRAAGSGPKSLRIWSAACSTGEEPYSMAHEAHGEEGAVRRLADHVAGHRPERRGAGRGPRRPLRRPRRPPRRARRPARVLRPGQPTQRWTIRPDVKAMVTWKQHNLLGPLGGEPFDCIFLKNVLIYFDTDSKKAVVRHVIDTLAKGGYLVTGPTEGIYAMLDPLKKVKPWLYQRTA